MRAYQVKRLKTSLQQDQDADRLSAARGIFNAALAVIALLAVVLATVWAAGEMRKWW